MDYQANYSFILSGIVLSLYFIYRSVSATLTYISRSRLIKQHHCEPVANTFGSWPVGFDDFREELEAIATDNLLNFYDARFKLYGHTWARNTGGLRRCKYVTCEPKILQAVLVTEFKNFPVGTHMRAAPDFGGSGNVFSLDGAPWEHARALLKPQFVRDQVADFTDLEKHVQRFFQRAAPQGKAGVTTVDLQPLLSDLIMDSSTETLFGESSDIQLGDEANSNKTAGLLLSNALGVGTYVSAVRISMGIMASWLLLGWELNRKYNQACKTCHAFVDRYVEKAIYRNDQKLAGKLNDHQLTSKKYVALNELAELTQNRDVLRDHAMGLLIAGRDTTSGMLSWTLYLLARHPDIYAKLRQEVTDALGEGDHGKLPTYNEIKGLQYLQWVLRESLRLSPGVPLNLRIAANDVILPAGGGPDGQAPLLIKAGEGLLYSVFSMHRRKDLYGEDADEFRPERWGIDEKGQGLRAIGWGYLPFGGGPRVCMGQQRALNEGAYILARVAQTFSKIERPDDVDPQNDRPLYRLGLTTSSGNGVRVKLTRAG